MRAYSKPGRVVCLEVQSDPADVAVGAGGKAELRSVAEELRLRWDPPTTIDANGVTISYSLQGEGEPVVLLHGLFSDSRIDWAMPGTTALLAKDHQVITLDWPGHGASDWPIREEAYGLELVEDVIRLLDHLQIPAAHVVGYCLGSIVAAKLMARHPDRVLSGALGGMGWLRRGGFARKVFRHFRRLAGEATQACARSLGDLTLTKKELESIRAPVIVLVGERDAVVRKLYVEPLRAARKDWRVIRIKRADHVNCREKPQFREEIARWLAARARR